MHLCGWVGRNNPKDDHDDALYCQSHVCGDLYCANGRATYIDGNIQSYSDIHVAVTGRTGNFMLTVAARAVRSDGVGWVFVCSCPRSEMLK